MKRLFDILDFQLEKYNLKKALVNILPENNLKIYSTEQYIKESDKVSRALLKLGVKKEDKIAIIVHKNCAEWNILDMGIQKIGAISVPIYSSISESEYEYIFNQAEIKLCFVSDKTLYQKIKRMQPRFEYLENLYSFEENPELQGWKEVLKIGESEANQPEVEKIKNEINEEDVVTIIYTSGTTGKPKGVMLTHKNILSNAIDCQDRLPELGAAPRALTFLPVCHVFERMLLYFYQIRGVSIYYAQDLESLGEDMKLSKPHIMTVVPRVIEKVYAKIYETGMNAGGVKTKLFRWSIDLIKDYDPTKKKPLSWYLKYKIANKLIFSKWREGVGGKIVTLVSGSAKLSEKLNGMFWAAGIPIIEGYGLTETSPVIAVNSHKRGEFKIGTVGKPIKNVEVKLADDGEILIKGSNVFKGYFKDEKQTQAAFTKEGYFKTGDVGAFDEGLLKITDRKKQIFKTSGGKYIVPAVLEEQLIRIPYIEQVMVVGEGQKMPCALIQPDFEYIKKWAIQNHIPLEDSHPEISENQAVIDAIQKEIESVNQNFGHWEQIKRFKLTPEVWSIENKCLTPTLKHRRNNIIEKFKSLYDEMYDL